ncbi:MAG: mycothiol system anti-sigma-R factor [Actinomycetota bacterium]|nr:mycothiol system anti-sigma-R factor [Actinomycetota bacterium]
MSYGKPHDTSCAEVIDHLYEYLDGELPDGECTKIRRHLDDCSPCLRQYGLEEAVKALVKRSCGCDGAPKDLRVRVLARIREVRVEIRSVD